MASTDRAMLDVSDLEVIERSSAVTALARL
jgi:hypothetical protein